MNHKAQAARARVVAVGVVGEGNIVDDATPTMGSEDFSYVKKDELYDVFPTLLLDTATPKRTFSYVQKR